VDSILIVDDEPALLAGYSHILAAEGYEIRQAATAKEAIQQCREERPDLVLLDAMLPDAAGLDVLRQIKEDPALFATPVIMISGLAVSRDEQAQGLESGADGYLAKPIDRRTLVAQIRALLRITETERRLRESEERQRQLVADLTKANRRLEEYTRLKAEFVANMSHELRTPLTAIIGFVQLLELTEAGKPMPKPYATAFERILRNGRHLLALIDDVLDVAKIEAGRMKINREPFDLTDTVEGAFRELQSLARQKGIDYRLAVPEALPFAFSDPLRVRQVVINLLSNAIKFTHQGSVEAELVRGELGTVRFAVRDTGVGIEESSLDMIFERFRQVDGSMSRSVGGAGLGLSIVRQIVALLGGTIEVTSQVDRGSIFIVTLPLVAPEPGKDEGSSETDGAAGHDSAAEPGTPDADPAADGRPLVLIIEDDPDASALLAETVESAGYRSRLAPSGPVGLSLARQLVPAAITLDVMMPGMDGWRVLQALKEDERTSRVPVIVCSIVDNRALGYRLGASDYLLKPVEPQRLIDALRMVRDQGVQASDGHILVVDDEYGVRELVSAALREGGYHVVTAADGEAALVSVAKSAPAAILCDLMMPRGMSGFELIARLRGNPATEHTPVLVITGKDLTPDDRRLIVDQIAEVIRKGDLMMPDLQSRLREILEELGVRPDDD
jgi:DNA-binding response OmpR family regulator